MVKAAFLGTEGVSKYSGEWIKRGCNTTDTLKAYFQSAKYCYK